jgi:DmsE family decaheme c-type cytochrome
VIIMLELFSPTTRPAPAGARCYRASLAVLAGALLLLSIPAGRAQEKPGAPPTPGPKPAEYVGSQTCQMCHEDISKAFLKNPHQLVETDEQRGWSTRACESCHGPGGKHAESATAADIRQPAKLKPAQTDRICLNCHLNQSTHIGRLNSSHAKNQVSCTACHSVHGSGGHSLVARKPAEINKQCSGCHADVWASFQKPFKHRLPEGAMSCVDCHNPHGSALPRSIQLTRSNEPGCMKCHGDKAGPFPFEHAPVRLEGCSACHQPHGSANARMLTRPKVQFLCMECHSNLPVPNPAPHSALATVGPALHDLHSPRFQNCTICHQKVHGSSVDRGLFK